MDNVYCTQCGPAHDSGDGTCERHGKTIRPIFPETVRVVTALAWESAGTDEPGDQNADSAVGAHSYWSLGPDGTRGWGVELIVRDAALEEVCGAGGHIGHFDTEDQAKAAAQRAEDSGSEA